MTMRWTRIATTRTPLRVVLLGHYWIAGSYGRCQGA